MGFEIKKTLYSITLDEGLTKAVIEPFVALVADERMILIASLEVDRIELLPTAKVELDRGLNIRRLRPVQIHRPLLWWPRPFGRRHFYKMNLRISSNGRDYIADTRDIGIRSVRIEDEPASEAAAVLIDVNNRRVDARSVHVPASSLAAGAKPAFEEAVSRVDPAAAVIVRIDDVIAVEGDEQLFDWCDQSGVMVWDSARGRTAVPDGKSFNFLCSDSGALNRCRNNPSLVLW